MGLWHKIVTDIRRAPLWVWIGGILTLILVYFAWRQYVNGGNSTITPTPTLDSGGGGGGIGPGPAPTPTLPTLPIDTGGSDTGGSDSGSSGLGIVAQTVKEGKKSATPKRTSDQVRHTLERSNQDVKPPTPYQPIKRTSKQVSNTLARGNQDLGAQANPRIAARGAQQPPAHLHADTEAAPHPHLTFRRRQA